MENEEKTPVMDLDQGPIEEHAKNSACVQAVLAQVSTVLANSHTGLAAIKTALTGVRREFANEAAMSDATDVNMDYLAVKRIANEVEVIERALGGTMRRLASMARTD